MIPLQLDTTDWAILGHLQAHARLTNVQLAERVGLSPASTLERVKKLERKGAIKGYRTQLAHQQLGLNVCMLVPTTLQPLTTERVAALQEAIAHIPEVVECYQVVGNADFLLKIVTTDMAAYQQLMVHQLGRIQGLQHQHPLLLTTVLKEAGIQPLPRG